MERSKARKSSIVLAKRGLQSDRDREDKRKYLEQKGPGTNHFSRGEGGNKAYRGRRENG